MKNDGTPEYTDFPILNLRWDAYYEYQDGSRYLVGSMAKDILDNPNSYQFGTISFAQINGQIDGQGNIDKSYAANIQGDDILRPLIMITHEDQTIRLVDGYHRAFRARQLGAERMPVWLLNRQQTVRFTI